MTGPAIDVDRVGVAGQLNTLGGIVRELEGALHGFPLAADGGSASNEIALIVAMLKTKAERVVAAEQGFSILALDVVDRLLTGDQDAADVFTKISAANFDD